MKHESIPPARAAAAAPSETPAQKAANRRVRKAAREAEASIAAEATAAWEGLPADPAPAAVLPVTADAPGLPPLDAHGFDPAEYKWVPVRRKPRKDGWTPQRQQEFIGALAATGSVERAAMEVQMSPSSAFRLRRSPGAEQFSAAWDVALQHAARVLLDTAFERAFNGSTEPVFDRDGNRVGTRHRQNDRLLMFLLRAYLPERFRHAHRDWRAPDEALPPVPAPMEEVLGSLVPVMPGEPHKLLPADELEGALEVADILDGELPHWLRGSGDAAPQPPPDAEFERLLEAAKKGEAAYRAAVDSG
jgi:hypothetical protein